MGTTFLANACAYLGMVISLAGIKARRDMQKWCFFIGPLFLTVGAYLLGNWVFTLLEAIVVLAGLGAILDVRPTILSWLVVTAGAVSLVFLWHAGLVRPDWSITGPVGLVLLALGVALAPRPVSNVLLFVAGVPLLIFSFIGGLWAFVILNIAWSAILLHSMITKRPRT